MEILDIIKGADIEFADLTEQSLIQISIFDKSVIKRFSKLGQDKVLIKDTVFIKKAQTLTTNKEFLYIMFTYATPYDEILSFIKDNKLKIKSKVIDQAIEFWIDKKTKLLHEIDAINQRVEFFTKLKD